MSRQGHIGAYHARLAQRQRNPSLQNHAESTSASRKIAISQQDYLNSNPLQGSSQSYKPSKTSQNRQHLQKSTNVSALSVLLQSSTAATANPAAVSSSSFSSLSLSPKAALSASQSPTRPLYSPLNVLGYLGTHSASSQHQIELFNEAQQISQKSADVADDGISPSSLASSSFEDDKEEQLQFQHDDIVYENVLQPHDNSLKEEQKKEPTAYEKARLEAKSKLEFLKKANRSRNRKTQCARIEFKALSDATNAQLNGGIHRTQNREYRALVLAEKRPPVVGFQMLANQLVPADKENQNNNLRILAHTPTKPAPPPASSPALLNIFAALSVRSVPTPGLRPCSSCIDSEHVSLPQKVGIFIIPERQGRNSYVFEHKSGVTAAAVTATKVSTPLPEASNHDSCWDKFAQVVNCPTIDLEQAMDTAWFGTAHGSRPKRSLWGGSKRSYSFEFTNSLPAPTTTDTATPTTAAAPATKKSGFMSRCASKLGSWVKKATPKQMEFLNEALL
ncbi:hypothetical protein Ndes2437B_g07962 [Nannochloris sp. 'desiccata']